MIENPDWSDLETQLQETKELLEEIEQRFLQVQRASHEKQELQSQQDQIRSQIQEFQTQEDTGDRSLSNTNSKIRRRPNPKNGQSSSSSPKEELLNQLQELSDRLEQIEADLESRLLSWNSFREPFWQIVRFVGIGIIIGVILRSCAN